MGRPPVGEIVEAAAGVVVVFALGLAARGDARPFDYRREADEMKPGSGLFSGKQGEFVFFGSSATKPEQRKPEEKTSAPKRETGGALPNPPATA